MKVLLLNQCFYPDVVSTAQHLTDLAVELRRAGHQVTVVASRRGYDDPSRVFSKRETYQGINIRRISTLNLGKLSRWRRALNFGSFLFNCAARLLLTPRQDAVVALTSPPLISVLGSLFVKLKGGRFFFWAMDLNPDEAIAAGWLKEDSVTARLLKALLNFSIRQADRTFVLDRFMKERLAAKKAGADKVLVVPPWAHDQFVQFDLEGRDAFRKAHGLTGKFVVMYSGNHSPCHPLDTLLAAAERLRDHQEIAFCFVGGGSEKAKVKEFARLRRLQNICCLPYQPLEKVSASLSAADLHVIVMGDPFVGIVHPCKLYNILRVGAPVLYLGPRESHVADLLSQLGTGIEHYAARHGEAWTLVEQIVTAANRQRAPQRYAPYTSDYFSGSNLIPKITSVLCAGPEAPLTTSAESQIRTA